MANEYESIKDTDSKFQGESFSRWYDKDDGSEWAANETGYWELFDNSGGSAIVNGMMVKSDDDMYIGFMIPKTATMTLNGNYLFLAHLTDSVDTDFDDVIVEYTLTFKDEKADS